MDPADDSVCSRLIKCPLGAAMAIAEGAICVNHGDPKAPFEAVEIDHRLFLADALESVRNGIECRGSLRTDRPNGRQADNDNQGQHHRVLDSGRAIFRLQKMLNFLGKLLHCILQVFQGTPGADVMSTPRNRSIPEKNQQCPTVTRRRHTAER